MTRAPAQAANIEDGGRSSHQSTGRKLQPHLQSALRLLGFSTVGEVVSPQHRLLPRQLAGPGPGDRGLARTRRAFDVRHPRLHATTIRVHVVGSRDERVQPDELVTRLLPQKYGLTAWSRSADQPSHAKVAHGHMGDRVVGS